MASAMEMPPAQYMAAPPAYPPSQSVYPTASFTPVIESIEGAPTVETLSQGLAPSNYIQPATYAPTVYVTEQAPYGASPYGGPPSYTPAPTASYMGGPASYQPPPMGAYGGTPSYTPNVVESMSPMRYGGPVSQTIYMPSQSVVMPQQGQTGSFVPAPGPPPPKLTEGMPDPSSVESQKVAYSKSIEAQLRQETGALAERNQKQKQSLAQMVQQQKAQYNLQMDQYLQQQAMAVDQQANAEMTMLQEAAMAQKMALEQQAAGLTLEYQQKKAQEEMMAREYQIQKQYFEAEQKLAATYQKQHGVDGRGPSQQQLPTGQQAMAQPQMQPQMNFPGLQPSVSVGMQQPPMYGGGLQPSMSVLQQQPPMTYMAGGPPMGFSMGGGGPR